MFFNVALNNQAVLHGFQGHFLLFGAGAARLTEYAIATACLTGLPLLTSAATFLRNAAGDFDLTSGILRPHPSS
jgi:hypothetical protein